MFQLGVLRGSLLFPNPKLLKLSFGAYAAVIPPEKDKAATFQKLKLANGVFAGHKFMGSGVWITFYYRDTGDLEKS